VNEHRLAAIDLVGRLAAAGRLGRDELLRLGVDLSRELRVLGVPIRIDSEGLRWVPPADALNAQQIAGIIRDAGSDCAIQVSPLTDSTNTRLLAAAADGERGPRVLLAECQLDGRGRRGRQWQASWGDALLMSFLVDTGRSGSELPCLAIATGVSVAMALSAIGVAGIRLKWPNDVLLAGAKLAGVLVEASGRADARGVAVIGIGLNWRIAPDRRAAIGQVSAELMSALPDGDRDRNRVAGHLILAVLAMAERFRREGLAPFLEGFARLDALVGRTVNIVTSHETREGVALGLADDGSLRIAHDDGERRYHSAEVSVRQA
jgi:BirA family biotin operon repressor/biotin-[acetyl-CoA-carboxylase] ligase